MDAVDIVLIKVNDLFICAMCIVKLGQLSMMINQYEASQN